MNKYIIAFFAGKSSAESPMTFYRILFLVPMLIFLGCSNEPDNAVPITSTKSGLDNIALYTMNNDPIDPQQFKGKTVFINFWATWCKPCIKEMPSIQKAKEILKDEEIVFLFATNDDAEAVATFKEENPFDFNYVQVKNLEDLNVQALPTTFIFDPGGALQFSEAGFRKWDDKESLDLILKISRSNDK